jgi:putative endonuclease
MYYETVHDPDIAADRERQIKKFRREKKIALFIKANPHWEDRSKEFAVSYKEVLMQAAGRRG